MCNHKTMFARVLIITALITQATAGPAAALAAYGICQTGCNLAVGLCYGGAGFIFGTVTGGIGVPAAVVACNAQLGVCMAACATMTAISAVAPTV
jgi:hypothetical protein